MAENAMFMDKVAMIRKNFKLEDSQDVLDTLRRAQTCLAISIPGHIVHQVNTIYEMLNDPNPASAALTADRFHVPLRVPALTENTAEPPPSEEQGLRVDPSETVPPREEPEDRARETLLPLESETGTTSDAPGAKAVPRERPQTPEETEAEARVGTSVRMKGLSGAKAEYNDDKGTVTEYLGRCGPEGSSDRAGRQLLRFNVTLASGVVIKCVSAHHMRELEDGTDETEESDDAPKSDEKSVVVEKCPKMAKLVGKTARLRNLTRGRNKIYNAMDCIVKSYDGKVGGIDGAANLRSHRFTVDVPFGETVRTVQRIAHGCLNFNIIDRKGPHCTSEEEQEEDDGESRISNGSDTAMPERATVAGRRFDALTAVAGPALGGHTAANADMVRRDGDGQDLGDDSDVDESALSPSNPPLTLEQWEEDPGFVKFIVDNDLPCEVVQTKYSNDDSKYFFGVTSLQEFVYDRRGDEDDLIFELGTRGCAVPFDLLLRAWHDYSTYYSQPAKKRARDDDREADGSARQKPKHALFQRSQAVSL